MHNQMEVNQMEVNKMKKMSVKNAEKIPSINAIFKYYNMNKNEKIQYIKNYNKMMLKMCN